MKKIYINRKIDILVLCVITSAIISLIFLKFLNVKIKPILLEIGSFEASKIESNIVNNAIDKILKEDYDTDDLFSIVYSNDGSIQTIDFNSTSVNKLLNTLTIRVQDDLKLLEDGMLEDLGINNRNISIENAINLKKGILLEVPIGMVCNNMIFSDLGPRIPIKLHYLGDVNSNISTHIKEYGINNALIEIYVNVEIEAKIMLPFITDKIVLKTSVPISIKMIQGNVPSYYGTGLIKDSSLYSLPLE